MEVIEIQEEVQVGDYILEKGDRIRVIQEKGPISKEGALKFVFKLPKEGKFTAEFLDGSTATLDVDPEDKSSGSYAFVTKGGRVQKAWNEKPSKEAAHDTLQNLKYRGS